MTGPLECDTRPHGEGVDRASKASCLTDNSPINSDTAPPLQAALDDLQRDFGREAGYLIAAAGWRHAALHLIRATEDLDIQDFDGAERNRQAAREHFIAGNAAFRRLLGEALQ